MNDMEFLQAFERCVLPEKEWTHLAHVRMAWLYLRREPLLQVLPRVQAGIQRYNGAFNKAQAYHETITHGFLMLIDERLRRNDSGHSFEQFCAENPDLLDGKLSALLKYYRKDTLFSSTARETFVAPDLAPFASRSSTP
jgi:hypothetical protein